MVDAWVYNRIRLLTKNYADRKLYRFFLISTVVLYFLTEFWAVLLGYTREAQFSQIFFMILSCVTAFLTIVLIADNAVKNRLGQKTPDVDFVEISLVFFLSASIFAIKLLEYLERGKENDKPARTQRTQETLLIISSYVFVLLLIYTLTVA